MSKKSAICFFCLLIILSIPAFGKESHVFFYKSSYLKHNVKHNGVSCLAIHLNGQVNGMKGKTVRLVAFIESPLGTKHREGKAHGKYRSKEGQICVGTNFFCRYDVSKFDDLTLYLPNEEISPRQGKNSYYISVHVWYESEYIDGIDACDANYGNENFLTFSMTGKSSQHNQDDYIECWKCTNGKCNWCNGTGNQMGPYSYITKTYTIWTCSHCRGTGKCSICHGTQKIKIDKTDNQYPPTNYKSRKQHKESMHGNAECPSCHRSGKCTACGGKGWYRNQYADYAVMDCSICNKTGKCQTCKGKGTISY